jgi:hypothetical protein
VRPTPTCSGFISRRGLAAWLWAWLLVFAPAVPANEPALEIIPLQHRSAAEILPVLQPFLATGGVLKADGARLLVRTTSANLAELRKLIAQLDRPLRRLLITVKQISGDFAGDGGATVWQTENRDDADRTQQIQVMEGGRAYIDAGRRIPIEDFTFDQSISGTSIQQQTRYAGAATGFYVSPRLNGDTVTVDLSAYQSTVQDPAEPPAFNVQSLRTTVSGKLGEWLAIGASRANAGEKDDAAIVYSTSQRGEQDKRILLRVTVMP